MTPSARHPARCFIDCATSHSPPHTRAKVGRQNAAGQETPAGMVGVTIVIASGEIVEQQDGALSAETHFLQCQEFGGGT